MFGDRIKQLRKSLSLTLQDFSAAIGISKGALSKIENNKAMPSSETLVSIRKRYSINSDWLLLGRGDMSESNESTLPTSFKPSFEKADIDQNTGKVTTIYDRMLHCPTANVHLGGGIAAGLPAESYADPDEEFLAVPNILLREHPKRYFLLRVQGDSMEPMILDDDLVLIYRQTDWNRVNGKVCAVRLDGEITLKEVQVESESEVIFLHPYNHKFKTIVIQGDRYQDVFLVGVLEAVIRTFDRHGVAG